MFSGPCGHALEASADVMGVSTRRSSETNLRVSSIYEFDATVTNP
jgi:hypothetical protein